MEKTAKTEKTQQRVSVSSVSSIQLKKKEFSLVVRTKQNPDQKIKSNWINVFLHNIKDAL